MNQSDQILIVKYITGQASADEAAMVEYLIRNSRQHEDFYVQYYEAWQNALQYNPGFINVEEAYSAFMRERNETVNRHRSPFRRFSGWLAAASLLIICSIGLVFYVTRPSLNPPDQAVFTSEIKVPKGATKKMVLPDGTTVWINAGSVMKFEEGFGKQSRTVFLDGEAYFDIAKNRIPFIVRTRHHTIRDIGTIFNVKAYSDENTFETVVVDGEISIEGKLFDNASESSIVSVKRQQVLKLSYTPKIPSDVAENEVVQDIDMIKVQKVNAVQLDEYTGWTEDLLVFEGKTFQEILRIMERKYDVEIVMDDAKLQNYEYTGSFKNIEDVDQALKILKGTTDLKYTTNGRVITITRNEP